MGTRNMLSSSSVIEWCTKCVPNAANVTNAVDNAAHAFASDAHTNLGFQITAVLAVFLGFLLCFFGWSLFHITLCLTGGLIGLGAGFAFFCGATSSLIAASIIGAICGLLLASIIIKLEKLGIFLCGAAGGVVAYMYLNGFLLHFLYNAIPTAHQTWMPAVMCTIFALVGATLAFFGEKHIIILATAFGGAYAIGFGVDRLAFASEHNNLNPVVLFSGGGCSSWHCYITLAILVLVGLVGVFVQYKLSSNKKYDTRFSRRRAEEDYGVLYLDQDTANTVILHSHRDKLGIV